MVSNQLEFEECMVGGKRASANSGHRVGCTPFVHILSDAGKAHSEILSVVHRLTNITWGRKGCSNFFLNFYAI